jgi:hypothetical protein
VTLRRKLRRTAASALAVAALGGGTLLGVTPAAASSGPITIMAACGDTFDPYTSGAKAYWEVQCTSTSVRISGWVEDTAADGQCAKVKATYPNGSTYYSPAACPKGEREYFTSPFRTGRSINAYLYEYDV